MQQKNNDNFEYVGPLYMGENQEPVQVVWDTGSDWLVVASATECSVCEGTPYDYSDEESFTKIKNSEMELSYGSAYANGF